MKTITKQIGNGRQKVTYTEIVQTDDGTKLRVEVASDSYQRQCHARVQRWDGEQWRFVHGIHFSNMKTETGLCYSGNVTDESFKADRDGLLQVAQAVLA